MNKQPKLILEALSKKYYYHGTNNRNIGPGDILTPFSQRRKERPYWATLNPHALLDKYKPAEYISRDDAVFMCASESAVNAIVGGTYLLTVKPIGRVEKHDANWLDYIHMLLVSGINSDEEYNELLESINKYWVGEPSYYSKPHWEYLCEKAEVVGVD